MQLGVLLAEGLPALRGLLADEVLDLVGRLLQRLHDRLSLVAALARGLLNVGIRLLDDLRGALAVRVDKVLELGEPLVDHDGAARDRARVRLGEGLGESEGFLGRGGRQLGDLVLGLLCRVGDGAGRVDGLLGARVAVVAVAAFPRGSSISPPGLT